MLQKKISPLQDLPKGKCTEQELLYWVIWLEMPQALCPNSAWIAHLPHSPSGYAKFWTGTTSIFVESETEIKFNVWIFFPLFLETQAMDKTERSYTDRALRKQRRGFASVNSSEIGISLLCNDSANSKSLHNALWLMWNCFSPVVNFSSKYMNWNFQTRVNV